MKIHIIGGGPAGLYFAYLMKKHGLAQQVLVHEQNPRSATYGFGVVFSLTALPYIEAADKPSFDALMAAAEAWDHLTIVHQDQPVAIDGNGFVALARLKLLEILHGFCEQAGVELQFGKRVGGNEDFSGFDLVVGADGVNSFLRTTFADAFKPSIGELNNRFIWYGTEQLFDTLTLTFRSHEAGNYVAHHYRYDPHMSTFIVECDEATWDHHRLHGLSEEATRRHCENVFANDLAGHRLISNNSYWRRFPVLTTTHWTHQNMVLLGDALHTIHFSIGSGTRLAIEDATALFQAFRAEGPNVAAALDQYEATRRPVAEKLLAGAAGSYQWYEEFAQRMPLSPHEFAYSYMTRSGRMSEDRLAETAPKFVEAYRGQRLKP